MGSWVRRDRPWPLAGAFLGFSCWVRRRGGRAQNVSRGTARSRAGGTQILQRPRGQRAGPGGECCGVKNPFGFWPPGRSPPAPPQLWPLRESASSPAGCEERRHAGPRLDPRRPASARSPHLWPQPRTRCSAAPQPRSPPLPGLALSPPGKRPRDLTAWPPPGSRPRRIPELQPETHSWAPAAVR